MPTCVNKGTSTAAPTPAPIFHSAPDRKVTSLSEEQFFFQAARWVRSCARDSGISKEIRLEVLLRVDIGVNGEGGGEEPGEWAYILLVSKTQDGDGGGVESFEGRGKGGGGVLGGGGGERRRSRSVCSFLKRGRTARTSLYKTL